MCAGARISDHDCSFKGLEYWGFGPLGLDFGAISNPLILDGWLVVDLLCSLGLILEPDLWGVPGFV